MSKKYILALLPLLCLLLCSCMHGGNVDNVTRIITNPTTYTEEEINKAMDVVIDEFSHSFSGCTLKNIEYDEERSSVLSDEWKVHPDTEVMVLLSDFDTDSTASNEGFNPDSSYSNWNWIMIKYAIGNWVIKTYGY